MTLRSDQALYGALCATITLVAVGWALFGLVRLIGRSRPELSLARPLAAALAARLAAAGLFAAVPSLQSLRGPDERSFLSMAEGAGDGSVALTWLGDLHVRLFAAQWAIFGEGGEFHLRVFQIGLAVAGIALVAAAVNDVAGPRAATFTAWIVAVEPSNVFFSTILHKEAPMILAGGLGLLGCVRMYGRRDLTAALILSGGVVVGLGARPYAGAAIAAAGVAVTLHASLRAVGPARRRAPRIAAACVVVPLLALAAAPTTDVFARLQLSQNANVSDQANLTLEPIDFSSPAAVARNLPRRVADFLTRPYPWQVGNLSQRFGVVGTLVAWLLFAVIGLAVLRRPRGLERVVPALYLLAAIVVAYSLSAGNAGTGFRYRTHVVLLLVGVACALTVAARDQRRTRNGSGTRAAMVTDRVLGERS